MPKTFLGFLEERALPYIVVASLTNYVITCPVYQISEWQDLGTYLYYSLSEFSFQIIVLESAAALCYNSSIGMM
jgi:hypothetical protein